jgi:hypothetical protein
MILENFPAHQGSAHKATAALPANHPPHRSSHAVVETDQ